MYVWVGMCFGGGLGDEGERIKIYRHVLYINLQLSTNAYQDNNTLSNGKMLIDTDSCFMTLVSSPVKLAIFPKPETDCNKNFFAILLRTSIPI